MDTYDTMVARIRELCIGKNSEFDLVDFLLKNKCYYLLDKNHKWRGSGILLANSLIHRLKYRECSCIFESINFPYAVVKGAVLSQNIYGSAKYRSPGDIDILVSNQDVDKLNKILENNGFLQGFVKGSDIVPFDRKKIMFYNFCTHQKAPYVKRIDSTLCPYIDIDVNTNVMWGESDINVDTRRVLIETEIVSIEGAIVRKLKPEMEFISLCLHHYKDLNSIYILYTRGINFNIFVDLYFSIKNEKIDPNKLIMLSKEMNVSKYVHYCLYYINMLFDDQTTNLFLDCFRCEQDNLLINSYGLTDSERKQWSISFFERIFSYSVKEYIEKQLTSNDLKKIETNLKHMY